MHRFMPRLLAISGLLALAVPVVAQDSVQGRLEDGDLQLKLNEYYDVYTFEGTEGEALTFEAASADFLPGGMLIDPSGNQVYWALGSAMDKIWAHSCRLTASGTWQIAVFQSYWQEGDYTLSMTPIEATPNIPACNE